MGPMRTGSGDPPIPPPSVQDVREASWRISGVALRTPLLQYKSPEPGPSIWIKAECLQPVGSFKLRGVFNWARSLSDADLQRGVTTQSAGNTAQALGYSAQLLGVPARSLLPDTAPQVKVDGVRAYGVTPVPVPFSALMDYVFDKGWEKEPYSYLNPWGDPSMLAGSGTIGLEILEDLPEVRAIYVPVGGGGLVSGIGSVIKELQPATEIIGVQSTACPSLHAALDAGQPRWVETGETICDGTMVPVVVDEMYPLVSCRGRQGGPGLRSRRPHRHRPSGIAQQAGRRRFRRHVRGGRPSRGAGRSGGLHSERREHRSGPAREHPGYGGLETVPTPTRVGPSGGMDSGQSTSSTRVFKVCRYWPTVTEGVGSPSVADRACRPIM